VQIFGNETSVFGTVTGPVRCQVVRFGSCQNVKVARGPIQQQVDCKLTTKMLLFVLSLMKQLAILCQDVILPTSCGFSLASSSSSRSHAPNLRKTRLNTKSKQRKIPNSQLCYHNG
jgi:hypothetical protein